METLPLACITHRRGRQARYVSPQDTQLSPPTWRKKSPPSLFGQRVGLLRFSFRQGSDPHPLPTWCTSTTPVAAPSATTLVTRTFTADSRTFIYPTSISLPKTYPNNSPLSSPGQRISVSVHCGWRPQACLGVETTRRPHNARSNILPRGRGSYEKGLGQVRSLPVLPRARASYM